VQKRGIAALAEEILRTGLVLKGRGVREALIKFKDRANLPSRAKQAAKKGLLAGELPKKHAAGAKAHLYFQLFAARLKSCPVTKHPQILLGVSFSAAFKAHVDFAALAARDPEGTPPCPFKTSTFSEVP
jgi:hypothetical protein